MKLIICLFYTLLIHTACYAQGQDRISHENSPIEPEVVSAPLSMLTPPEGFVASDKFNGYIHYKAGSAIIMTLIKDIPFLLVSKGMTDEFFEENKMTKISESPVVTNNGTKGIKYKLSFELQGMEFIRYIAYIGDLNQTLWLNITYPKMVEELVEDEILKSIQSVTLNSVTNGRD